MTLHDVIIAIIGTIVKPIMALQFEFGTEIAENGSNLLQNMAIPMNSGAEIEPVSDLTERSDNRKATETAERLRLAVSRAGGLAHVGAISGVPTRTLSRYLSGQEMKVQSLAAIADACGVSIEWLATGRGTTARHEVAPPSQPAAPWPLAQPPDLFSIVNVDKMVGCLEAAMHDMPPKFGKLPMRKVVQVALVLYDALTAQEAEEKATGKVITTEDTPPAT